MKILSPRTICPFRVSSLLSPSLISFTPSSNHVLRMLMQAMEASCEMYDCKT